MFFFFSWQVWQHLKGGSSGTRAQRALFVCSVCNSFWLWARLISDAPDFTPNPEKSSCSYLAELICYCTAKKMGGNFEICNCFFWLYLHILTYICKNITFANLMCMSATHRKCVLNHSAKGTQIEHKHLLYCCIFYHQLSILKFTNFLSTTSPCLFKRTNSTGQSSKGNLKRKHKSQTSPEGDSSALESPGLSESNRRRKSTVGKGWLP